MRDDRPLDMGTTSLPSESRQDCHETNACVLGILEIRVCEWSVWIIVCVYVIVLWMWLIVFGVLMLLMIRQLLYGSGA